MKMRRNKYGFFLLLPVLLMFGMLVALTGCGQDASEDGTVQKEKVYQVYYMNLLTTDLVVQEYTEADLGAEDDTTQMLAFRLVEQMMVTNANSKGITDYKSVFTDQEQLISVDIDNTVARVHLTGYVMQDSAYEVLKRAAITKTLTALDGIESVYLLAGDQPVMDTDLQPIGQLKSDDFVNVVGRNVNDYTQTSILLYFAGEDGSQLMGEQVEITYSGNFSLEEYVVERLIEGPENDSLKATISPTVSVLGVSVSEGTCYVNFDNAFLTATPDIDAYLTIYSIVDSLTELPGVNNVRITVNGSSDVTYHNTISLDTVWERNLDYYGGMNY